MDFEQEIAEALKAELERQAANGGVTVSGDDLSKVTVHGTVDLESLAQVAVGKAAGGP